MDRYFYETPDKRDPGTLRGRFRVFDRLRGSPHDTYSPPWERAVALCETRGDAELVTRALNTLPADAR